MTALTSETTKLMGLYKNKKLCFGSQGDQQDSYQTQMLGYPQQDQGLVLQEIY